MTKQSNEQYGILDEKPKNVSALSHAQTQQTLAAKVGFDWPHIRFVLDKLHEEIKEFEQAYLEGPKSAAEEELGDILFVCANLARHLQSDAETILRRANAKFERRFKGIEDKVNRSGKKWQDFGLAELEEFWQQVKYEERKI